MDMPADGGASGAAIGIGGWKLLTGLAAGTGIAAGLAAFVVMCLQHPRDAREWRVALVCTLVFSIGGGAAVIRYFGLHVWANDAVGCVGMLGIVFACGLPGWAIVRWLFTWFNNRRDSDIAQIAAEVRAQLKG
jgi:hypothetical protein